MHLTRIVFLAHFVFSVPARSTPLYYQSQAAFPQGVQIQKNLPDILSFGPIFIEVTNGALGNSPSNGKEWSNGSPMGMIEGPKYEDSFQQTLSSLGQFDKCGKDAKNIINSSGKVPGLGLTSLEIFQDQVKSIAASKAKEKELEDYIGYLTNIMGKPEAMQAGPVKLSLRPKVSSRPGAESEAVSYVINQLSQSSITPSASIQTEGGKLLLGVQHMSPHTKLTLPGDYLSHPKSTTVLPQQQTITTYSTTQTDRYSPSTTASTGPIQTTLTQASTRKARNLRSVFTP